MGEDMVASTIEPTSHIGHIPLEDPVSLGYTVSNIVNIAIAYYKITEDPEEKEYAKKIIWSMINEWLEEVAPLRYIPGLIEEIASITKKKLWDTNIDESILEELLVYSIVFRERALKNEEPEILGALAESLAVRAEILIEELGGRITGGMKTYEIIHGINEPSEKILLLTTLIAILLVLSTNP